MYQVFGMDIVDSKELSELIEKETKIKISEDLTKGTQREDAIGFKAMLNITNLGYKNGTEFSNEEAMDQLFSKTDGYIEEELKRLLPKTMDFTVFSNAYDQVEEQVNLLIVVMHISNAQRKLRDVLKRLLRI